jgi:uncharacterized cupin superfamily protein
MTIKSYPWGMMQWIERGHKSLGISFAKMSLRAGCETDLHFHDNAHEFIYVEEGEVLVEMAGTSKENADLWQRRKLLAAEKIAIQQRRAHKIINESNATADLTIVYTHHNRQFTEV